LNDYNGSYQPIQCDVGSGVLATADYGIGGATSFYNPATGSQIAASLESSFPHFSVRFDDSEDLVVCVADRYYARVYEWRTGRQIGTGIAHPDTLLAASFLPGSNRIVTGGAKLNFWAPDRGLPIRPPIDLEGGVREIEVLPESGVMLVAGKGIWLFDLEELFPEPILTPEAARELAEIDSGSVVKPGGGSTLLSLDEWLSRWRQFRAAHPDFSGHRIGE